LAVYFTGAAQNPPHLVKFDFFNIHAVNLGIFFCSFIQQPWLSMPNKIRLLEWKIRMDLAMYASPRPPKLLIGEISNYKSKKDSSWEDVFNRVKSYHDDGHACKLVRALANAEKFCKKYEDKDEFLIKGDMWRKLGNMAIDSVEAGSPDYVRGGAWSSVPLRNQSRI
jgi:Questin oxidase-like